MSDLRTYSQPSLTPVMTSVDESAITESLRERRFFWLALADPTDMELDAVAELLELHPLAIEDTKKFGQRPKLEHYDDYELLVFYGARTLDVDAVTTHSPGELVRGEDLLQEVHIYISARYCVSVHRGACPAITALQAQTGFEPPQRVLYQLMDALVDSFFPVLAELDVSIDLLEDSVVTDTTEEQLQRVFAMKRRIIGLRRVVNPERELVARNIEHLAALSGVDNDSYFRDIQDHLQRVCELVDTYRDLLSGATDLYLSLVANRQGAVAKQLTVIASIFLPLSFLTGFFGMNFAWSQAHYQQSTWDFFGIGVGIMLVSAAAMFILVWRKHWLR